MMNNALGIHKVNELLKMWLNVSAVGPWSSDECPILERIWTYEIILISNFHASTSNVKKLWQAGSNKSSKWLDPGKKNSFAMLSQPPYKFNLFAPGCFLLNRLKSCLKVDRFDNLENLEKNVTWVQSGNLLKTSWQT